MTWERLNYQDTVARIAEIDDMFAAATGWGLWMVECANEREALVNQANGRWNAGLKHNYQARTASGGRTD